MSIKVKQVPQHILDKIKDLGYLRSRKLENGDYEVYDTRTNEVIQLVSKDDLDKSAKRFGLPKEPPK